MSDSDSPPTNIQIFNPENQILPEWHPHRPVTQHGIPHFYDEATLLNRFTKVHERNNWMMFFRDRAVVGERRIEWESLPTRMKSLLRRISLERLAKSPSPTSTMNRAIVREFYTLVRSKIDASHDIIPASGVYKLRRADVCFTSEWINRYYRVPGVEASNISDYNVEAYEGHVEYHQYPNEWLHVMFEWISSSVYGTVHTVQPSNDLKSFLYAVLSGEVDFGRDIVARIGDISLSMLGDGYLYYPFLITALAIDFHVPEYDNDDIDRETSPIIFSDHPWATIQPGVNLGLG